jgi:hypothetical protein
MRRLLAEIGVSGETVRQARKQLPDGQAVRKRTGFDGEARKEVEATGSHMRQFKSALASTTRTVGAARQKATADRSAVQKRTGLERQARTRLIAITTAPSPSW